MDLIWGLTSLCWENSFSFRNVISSYCCNDYGIIVIIPSPTVRLGSGAVTI